MMQSEVIAFDLAVKRIIRRELAVARRKWGAKFDLICIEQSWGHTLGDMKMLATIRGFNRTGRTGSSARSNPVLSDTQHTLRKFRKGGERGDVAPETRQ